ncbi:MAG: lysophospholipid acyltransferase family protein [Bacteroidales bacterium]|nr:lysophospholipid acyltransferase family protein [Bacteroidales bacterium]
MSFLVFLIFRFFVVVFSLLPFRVVYVVSDIFAFILRYLIRYRYNVIISNLRNSFPEFSEKQIRSLLWPIYRNITDLMVETMKGFTISPKNLEKHIYTTNIELMHELYQQYDGIIGVLGHYGNWEWAALLAGLKLKQKTVALYKPLSNKHLDNFIHKTRSRFGIELCPIYITASIFEKYKNKKVFYALVADQSPSNIKKAIWIKFLNQDTACLQGPEKYARMYQMPVVYVHITRVKRGIYEITFKLLHTPNNLLNENEITVKYMQTLESYIISDPVQWLWSHRRWKHKKI